MEPGSEEYKAAQAEIARLIREAEGIIEEAEKVSDASGITFNFELAYGMGGTYVPEQVAEEWEESAGWMASSMSC